MKEPYLHGSPPGLEGHRSMVQHMEKGEVAMRESVTLLCEIYMRKTSSIRMFSSGKVFHQRQKWPVRK
jgi:hypothetical protein